MYRSSSPNGFSKIKTEWAPPTEVEGDKLQLKQSLAKASSNSGKLSVLHLLAPSKIKELICTEALFTCQVCYTHQVCICDVTPTKYQLKKN